MELGTLTVDNQGAQEIWLLSNLIQSPWRGRIHSHSYFDDPTDEK
jgi:hypothetical protein